MNSDRHDDGTFRTKTTGDIADLEVIISVKGDDEQLASMIEADLSGRADEIKQMIDHGIPPEMAERQYEIEWERYLKEEIEA